MSDELALVDTNVLVYAFHRESEHHAACRTLLDQAQNGQIALCITSQVLAEFYAIVCDLRCPVGRHNAGQRRAKTIHLRPLPLRALRGA